MAGSSFSDIALEVGQGNVNQATGRAQNRPTVATDISLIALDVGQGGNQQTQGPVADIIEFCESPWGLGMTLLPVQRVILKAHYGIPLDDIKTFRLRDWRANQMVEYTEKTYLRMLYDAGRCNIPDVKPGEERRELILSIGRRSGKCVLGDTLVLTDRGIFPIEKLGDKDGPEVQNLDIGVAQKGSKRSRSKYFYNGGVKPTRTLTTGNGYVLGGTDNHRIKVLSDDGLIEWRYLADVKIDDRVVLHKATDLWASDYQYVGQTKVDTRWGRLLGYLVGGSVGPVWDDFIGLYDDLLGSLEYTEADAILTSLGINLTGIQKNIPWVVMQSPKDVVEAFIQGLFDIQDSRSELVFVNKRIAQEVQILLLNMGFVSKLHAKNYPVSEFNTDSYIQDFYYCLTLEFDTGPSDYFYDPIVDIQEGENSVYDLNVPDGESFVANGLINHNTFLAAAISAYETYKLLIKVCPQKYYGLLPTNSIQIISVATDRDQAGLLYQEASGHFRNCNFFLPYTANNTQSYARFQTPYDINKYGRYSDDPTAKATIKVTFRSCIAKGLRGAGNIVVILDEMAHFTDNGQSSAEEVYKAVTPSKSTFSQKDPDTKMPVPGPDGEDGVVESRVIAISSPLGKQGQFYKLFQQAMKGGRPSKGMLAIQAPTWEVNPTIPFSELESEYYKDPASFFVEYGGEFSDRTKGWIERDDDLLACVDPDHRPTIIPPAKRPHFIGIDVGLVNDYTAVCIGHQGINEVGDQIVVLDYIDRIHAGEGRFTHRERLEFDDVADWILDLSKRFYLAEGIFDQWGQIPLEDALAKRGLGHLKGQKFTGPELSEVFQNFKSLMWDQRIKLYNWPIPEDVGKLYCPYLAELLELQVNVKSKYVVEVHKPNIEGKSDDMSDALVRMVWLASRNMGKAKIVTSSYSNSYATTQKTQMQIQLRRARLKARQGGSDPARRAVRRNPIAGYGRGY